MKRLCVGASVLAIGLLAFGCGDDSPVRPDLTSDGVDVPSITDAKRAAGDLLPDGYYAFFTGPEGNYSEFSHINTHSGVADFVWHLQFPVAGDWVTSFGWVPFGFAFDVDGTMYMTQNIVAFDPTLVRSQFARVDRATGEVTSIGTPVEFNTSGGDIDACGNFYVCGFQVDALGYIWGNDSLWRVDKETGAFIEVGPTGHTNWMDLAFDANGTLWGTFDNQLYVIDTDTGASTLMCDIQDVPDAGDPHRMEIMSIAFDKHDVLYGTGLTVYWEHPDGSPVMRIDPYTGASELLGYSHTPNYNHGGDILPDEVRIAHATGNGQYKCMTVGMSSLEAHLAHGDYVPGTVGHSCDCP